MNFLSRYHNEIIELVFVILVIFVSFKAIGIFNKNLKNKILSKQADTTILGFMPLIDKLLKITVVFLAVATVLQNHGYSIASLIAGFGITGLAVGFGAQATISNIFGSFSLLADKAYKIGDYIVINQSVHDKAVEGFVEDINLRSTKIRDSDGGLLIIPNNIVANGVVKNVSQKQL
jgi:MscS family membrane protein